MKRIILFASFLCIGFINLHAQGKYGIPSIFTIESHGDEVNFLKLSTDPTQTKPVIVFCIRSFPVPLLVEENGETIIPFVRNLIYDGLLDHYNLVLIGKPNTPAIAKKEDLSEEYNVVTDLSKPLSFRPEFLENNYLEKHVEQTVAVLKYLKGQEWVDASRILLMGHSQGAHIAVHVAYEYPEIAALGYFGGNPLGRFAQFVVTERYRSLKGEASMEKTQEGLDRLYNKWRVICRDLAKDNNGDPDRTWKSFSQIYIDKLTALKMPVFVPYGTEDPGGHLCYLLPVYFELAGKTDYETISAGVTILKHLTKKEGPIIVAPYGSM